MSNLRGRFSCSRYGARKFAEPMILWKSLREMVVERSAEEMRAGVLEVFWGVGLTE